MANERKRRKLQNNLRSPVINMKHHIDELVGYN